MSEFAGRFDQASEREGRTSETARTDALYSSLSSKTSDCTFRDALYCIAPHPTAADGLGATGLCAGTRLAIVLFDGRLGSPVFPFILFMGHGTIHHSSIEDLLVRCEFERIVQRRWIALRNRLVVPCRLLDRMCMNMKHKAIDLNVVNFCSGMVLGGAALFFLAPGLHSSPHRALIEPIGQCKQRSVMSRAAWHSCRRGRVP